MTAAVDDELLARFGAGAGGGAARRLPERVFMVAAAAPQSRTSEIAMELVVSTPDCGLVARHPFEFTSRCASVPVMYELGSEFSIEVAIRRDGATIATFDISLEGDELITLKTTTSGTETHKLKTRTVETSEYSVTVDVKVRTDDEHVEASAEGVG